MALVRFVLYSEPEEGQTCVICGNSSETGDWRPERALKLHKNGNQRVGEYLSSGGKLEFKCCRVYNDGRILWESGNNRVLDVVAGRGFQVNFTWMQRPEGLQVLEPPRPSVPIIAVSSPVRQAAPAPAAASASPPGPPDVRAILEERLRAMQQKFQEALVAQSRAEQQRDRARAEAAEIEASFRRAQAELAQGGPDRAAARRLERENAELRAEADRARGAAQEAQRQLEALRGERDAAERGRAALAAELAAARAARAEAEAEAREAQARGAADLQAARARVQELEREVAARGPRAQEEAQREREARAAAEEALRGRAELAEREAERVRLECEQLRARGGGGGGGGEGDEDLRDALQRVSGEKIAALMSLEGAQREAEALRRDNERLTSYLSSFGLLGRLGGSASRPSTSPTPSEKWASMSRASSRGWSRPSSVNGGSRRASPASSRGVSPCASPSKFGEEVPSSERARGALERERQRELAGRLLAESLELQKERDEALRQEMAQLRKLVQRIAGRKPAQTVRATPRSNSSSALRTSSSEEAAAPSTAQFVD